MYMYQLERGIYVSLNELPAEIQERVSALKEESLSFPPDEFWTAGHELIRLILKSGYNEQYITPATKSQHRLQHSHC